MNTFAVENKNSTKNQVVIIIKQYLHFFHTVMQIKTHLEWQFM